MTKTATAPETTPFKFAGQLNRLAARVDAHPVLVIGFLLLNYIAYALRRSSTSPLWHDELFTYTISKLPTLHDIFYWVNAVDMNPPISYLLTRASFHLFGVGTLQCRLPNMCGFALALVCIFLFVRRLAGTAWGGLAAALLLATPVAELSIQARPYGLTLGFASFALLAWQGSIRSTGRTSWRYSGLFFVALSLLLLSHVFALLPWASIALAELVNTIQRRKLDIPRALALLLPLGWTLLYLPYIALHANTLYPIPFQPSSRTWYEFYGTETADVMLAIVFTFLILFLLGAKDWLRGSDRFALSKPEWVAVFALTLMPALLILDLKLKHGTFVPRYGATCTLGISILLAVYVQWQAGGRRVVAVLALVLALVVSLRFGPLVHLLLKPRLLAQTEPPTRPFVLDLADPSLPVVANSGLTYIEMNFREPSSLLAHTFYLTDGPAAAHYAHATIFEIMAEEKQMFHFQGNVDTYDDFIQNHPHFYVIGTYEFPEDWLLRKLQDDGADITLRDIVQGGYKDHQLYEIRLHARAPKAATSMNWAVPDTVQH